MTREEAIKAIKAWDFLDNDEKEVIKTLIPELKESDDEKVRKGILELVRQSSEVLDKQNQNSMIAWLEKQVQQPKKVSIWKHWEGGIAGGSKGEQIFLIKNGLHYSISSCLGFECDYIELSELDKLLSEKQGGQRPTSDIRYEVGDDGSLSVINGKPFDYEHATIQQRDFVPKVELKFKVGNWYQCTKDFFGKGVTFDKNTAYYCAKEGCLQNEYGCHIAIVKDLYDNFKLWTIQDAKDGDVLSYVTDEEDLWIMIYRSLYEPYEGHVHYHALLVNDNFGDNGTCCICIGDLKPATKEQRDLLFQKMHEAGYKWDAKKKELKKIEQSIDIPFGAKDSELQEVSYYIPEGFHAEIDGNKVVIKKGEQKPAWSEEDKVKDNWELIHEFVNKFGRIPKDEDELNVLVEYVLKRQNPTWWSEEDEKKRNLLINILNVNHPNEYFKVNPANTLNMEAMHTKELVNWLKSLKERNTWKPSDEQIEYLAKAITTLGNEGDNKTSAILYELRTDLKKLK